MVAEANIQQSILPEQLGNFTFEQDEAFFLKKILSWITRTHTSPSLQFIINVVDGKASRRHAPENPSIVSMA